MAGRFDLEVGASADRGAEADEQLGEDRDGVGLRVRRDRVDDLAGQLVIDSPVGRGRPPRGRRQQLAAGGLIIIRRLVKQRQGAHSAAISATAARAADSSTIAFFEANAAINEDTARLLTWRGRPRETSWINATASSENRVSERPASAR
jgi:hypothetical protein